MTAVSRAGFLVALLGGLLALWPRLADAYVLPKLLSLTAGTLLLWLGAARSPARRTALDLPFAALWAALLLSFAASSDQTISTLGMYPQAFHGLLTLALCTALYYGTAAAAADPDAADWVVGVMIWAAIPLAGYAVLQKIAGDPVMHLPLPGGRATSAIGSPVMLGGCLALLLPLALHRALDKKSAVGAAAAALLAIALLLTRARGAWLGAAAGVPLYLLWSGRLKPRAFGAVALGGALAAALALGRGVRPYDAARLELWRSAAAGIAAHPWLGYGPDNFLIDLRAHKTEGFLRAAARTDLVQHSAHDDLLQAAVTLGVVGLAAYLWLLWALAAELRRRLASRARPRDAALAAGLAGLLVAAKFNPVPVSGLALAAVAAALAAADERAVLGRAASRAACGFAVLLCAASLALLCRLAAADWYFNRGRGELATAAFTDPAFKDGIDSLRRATELAPWRMDYVTARCDTIFRLAAIVPPDKGREFLGKALGLARDAERLHPNDPSPHELAATALMLEANLGADTLREAQAEILRASALDPSSMFTLQRRLELAEALRDRPDFDRASALYRRVLELTGQSAAWARLLRPSSPRR